MRRKHHDNLAYFTRSNIEEGMLLFLHVQSQVNNNNKSGPFIHFSIILVSIK